MPSATSGMSGNEILTYLQQFTGNYSSDFLSWATTFLPLAEMRYCKVYDWNFLYKTNLPLTVVSGTNTYALSTSTIGYFMPADNVKSIFCASSNLYLRKVSLDEIRRMDPATLAGSATQHVMFWAEAGDNTIQIYPPNFADTTLYVDGKVVPTALLTLANYPTVPYRYQEAFIQYLVANALLRENDDRAQAVKSEAIAAIRADIATDLASLGNTDEPRMRHMQEIRLDGVSPNADPLNMIFDPYTYY